VENEISARFHSAIILIFGACHDIGEAISKLLPNMLDNSLSAFQKPST